MAARTLIPTLQATPNGVVLSFTTGDVTNGMKTTPASRLFLLVSNADVSNPHTVTLVLPPPPDLADAADRTVVVGANSNRVIGPFPGNLYTQPTAADPADVGFIHINVDSTQLGIAAVRL